MQGNSAGAYGSFGLPPNPPMLTLLPPKVGPYPYKMSYQSESSEKDFITRLRMNWAHYYFLAGLAIFSAPVTAALQLSRDASVRYWVGDCGEYALLIPGFLVIFHVFNCAVGEPRMFSLIFTSVIPAIILVVISLIHLHRTYAAADLLVSKDCTTLDRQRDTQRSWRAAAEIFERCLNRTVAEHHISFNEGLKLVKLQDCIEYKVRDPDIWAAHRGTWRYLKRMEEEHECSGWCVHSVPLWSSMGTKDACAITAGNFLTHRVNAVGHRMLAYSLVVGIGSILAIMLAGRLARRRGREWTV